MDNTVYQARWLFFPVIAVGFAFLSLGMIVS